MPARIAFRDVELQSFYELEEVIEAGKDPFIVLTCKKCPGEKRRVYEATVKLPEGVISRGDRNALLAHARAHEMKATLRRRS